MKFNSRLLIMVVLLGFISVEINADWLDYQQFKGTAPGDTYLLNLKQGESLTFQVTYQLFIVDLYLFRLDSNTNSLVLVGGGFSQNNPQNFYYNVPTTGIYYLYTSDYSYPH